MTNTVDAQSRIDAIAYPPTHDYELDGLRPRGPFAERLQCLEWVAPRFWEGRTFLDVGANKGFFSLLAAQRGFEVSCLEPDAECASLLRDLGHPPMVGDFRSWAVDRRFDRVFAGNVMHHVTREAGGYVWAAKMAALCEDGAEVAIEDPTEESPDVGDMTEAALLGAMRGAGFDLLASGPTTSYTVGRKLWLFRRRGRSYAPPSTAGAVLRQSFVSPNGSEHAGVTLTEATAEKRFSAPLSAAKRAAIEMASSSPRATSIDHWLTERGQVVGWSAERARDPYQYREAEGKVWRAYLEHMSYLAKLGYADLDPGTINWTREEYTRTFDKSEVKPASAITGIDLRHWFTNLCQSYEMLPVSAAVAVYGALASRSAHVIGRCCDVERQR